jgi:Myb-like DNA-binding domain
MNSSQPGMNPEDSRMKDAIYFGTSTSGGMEIHRNDIKQGDVQIVDRQFLEPEQVSRSFYHELIRNCAEKLEKHANVVQPATRMVDIVAKKRQGRFIYCHHSSGAPARFYLLSREEAIAKLSTDLSTRLQEMKKLPVVVMTNRPLPSINNNTSATVVVAPPPPPVAKAKPPAAPSQMRTSLIGGTDTQLKYAIRLVLKVCMAEMDTGLSPIEAARILDHSVLQNGEVETPKQRKLRMQMRLRFLAVARTEQSLFIFSRNLLRSWGVEVTKKKNLMISSIPGFRFEKDEAGFPKSVPLSFLEREFNTPSAMNSTSSLDDHRCGSWTTEERRKFVQLVDQHGWGSWREIAKELPTRYVIRSMESVLLSPVALSSGQIDK